MMTVVNGRKFHGTGMLFRKSITESKGFFKVHGTDFNVEPFRIEEEHETMLLQRMVRIFENEPLDPIETELAEARQKFRQSFKSFLREMLDEIEREDNNY